MLTDIHYLFSGVVTSIKGFISPEVSFRAAPEKETLMCHPGEKILIKLTWLQSSYSFTAFKYYTCRVSHIEIDVHIHTYLSVHMCEHSTPFAHYFLSSLVHEGHLIPSTWRCRAKQFTCLSVVNYLFLQHIPALPWKRHRKVHWDQADVALWILFMFLIWFLTSNTLFLLSRADHRRVQIWSLFIIPPKVHPLSFLFFVFIFLMAVPPHCHALAALLCSSTAWPTSCDAITTSPWQY